MRLLKLTVSGFKSFAKTAELEFPVPATAIVGPNGSGKSNIAEAIRWVLGEQSMKSLRGRKGEDLIFNGSPGASRMGKAAVALTFDNREHTIPTLDFDEIVIERKIFRDGTNEYYLNASQVRLKDIVELLARMGLGETKHNIISQGEVDRILAANARERRELLEEAIGLRLYQLRQREAERKLEETHENMQQIEALIREISPHLKFLKSQADKAEKRETARQELEDYFRAYIAKERASIDAESGRLEHERGPKAATLKTLEREITELSRDMEVNKRGGEAPNIAAVEEEIRRQETRRRELERELGRIEGRMESDSARPKRGIEKIELRIIESRIAPILDDLRQALALSDISELKKRIESAITAVGETIRELSQPVAATDLEQGVLPSLELEQGKIRAELESLDIRLKEMRETVASEIRNIQRLQAGMKERWARIREREEEATALRRAMNELAFEEEKNAFRRRELERMIGESGFSRSVLEDGDSPFADLGTEELKKKIERLRARLEEIGGIDPMVLKEYEDTRTRHDFLASELADLTAARRDLEGLITELGERIERDFEKGFAKIKEEFHNYFRIIFGGGKGTLEYINIRKRKTEDLEAEETDGDGDDTPEYGVSIDVEIPRKRIKGLDMLSGGERALTSIALLFAITAVNPPPFLVLDETDAALDEANSQKYAAILKELSKKTQLILITHNRETMKQAGVLYGVTMGDDGVSKLLSLKLEEAESYGNRL